MKPNIETIELPRVQGLAVRATVPLSELSRFFGTAYGELARAASSAGATCVTPPFARYLSLGTQAIEIEAVAPLDRALPSQGHLYAVDIPRGVALQVLHRGPYDTVGVAYRAIDAYVHEHRLTRGGVVREVYLNDPTREPDPAKLETLVIQPLA